jgi:retron-type reverse transcriptase
MEKADHPKHVDNPRSRILALTQRREDVALEPVRHIVQHRLGYFLLELLEGWLRQDIVKGLERWTPTGGTPQGAVISPLLANLYLHQLNERMAKLGYRMVRYADDFVVLCPSGTGARGTGRSQRVG